MEAIFRLLNRNVVKLQRHAFSTNVHSHSMFQDLDDLIRQKENFIDYIKFEYFISILYNTAFGLSTLLFFRVHFSTILSIDPLSTIWTALVCFIKLVEIIPKVILIYQTVRISNNSNDSIICSRRLMHMTRSNLFYYNALLGYVLISLYTVYFFLIRKSSTPTDVFPKFYSNLSLLTWGFCLRLGISFLNYNYYFKYNVNEADQAHASLYIDYNNRVSPDVIELIETHLLSKENIDNLVELNEEKERDVCCICMNPFCVNETVKVLPCNTKHVFHKPCIEKWLSHNKACPNCRKEVTRKTVEKVKMF